MDTSGFSVEKSAAECNVLLYLYRLGVGSTPLRAAKNVSNNAIADSRI